MVLSHGLLLPPLSATRASIYTVHRHRVINPEFIRSRHKRIDGVQRQESAGTGPVVLKMVRVTGAACSGIPENRFDMIFIFSL